MEKNGKNSWGGVAAGSVRRRGGGGGGEEKKEKEEEEEKEKKKTGKDKERLTGLPRHDRRKGPRILEDRPRYIAFVGCGKLAWASLLLVHI
ncbi:hypothetical protein E4U54_002763 [Claviceps lovelessii]|nr:hypothetical protein E4U54_002763 [Claviceps lovelessii]